MLKFTSNLYDFQKYKDNKYNKKQAKDTQVLSPELAKELLILMRDADEQYVEYVEWKND
jgi:hypothetical protein